MIPGVAREVFGENVELASRYVDILASWGIEWGLIGPREAPRLWDRHVLNSAALSGLIERHASVVDVGSGAGLPGVPLALARPDLKVCLVEPLLRRFRFLMELVAELELGDRVRVLRSRAEELDCAFDAVTARAVAPLVKLIGWTQRLFVPRGELLALKGSSAETELAAAEGGLRKRGLSAELVTVYAAAGSAMTRVVRVRAVADLSR